MVRNFCLSLAISSRLRHIYINNEKESRMKVRNSIVKDLRTGNKYGMRVVQSKKLPKRAVIKQSFCQYLGSDMNTPEHIRGGSV